MRNQGALELSKNSSPLVERHTNLIGFANLPVLILTSTKQEFLARKIAKLLVSSHLAAAVQIREVDSYYRWKDEIHNHNEFALTIKTIESHFSRIEELIKREHTYDIPQLIMLDFKGGSAEYLRWIEQQVS
jgi:periplasmic divalent cation tolerance protein